MDLLCSVCDEHIVLGAERVLAMNFQYEEKKWLRQYRHSYGQTAIENQNFKNAINEQVGEALATLLSNAKCD